MKWVFLAFMAVLVPSLGYWLRQNVRHAPKVWALIGFLPFVTKPWHLYVGPISWPTWPGYSKGFELTLLDAIALGILLSCAPGRKFLPFKIPLFIFLAMLTLSAVAADLPQASLFGAWQFARMILVAAAISSICDDERAPMAVITGMVAGLSVQAAIALSASLGGSLQTGGSLEHQNLLGLMSHFVVFPSLALLLSGRRSWAALIGPLAGALAVILTASRATIGLAAPGYVATILISMIRKPTPRKSLIASISIIGFIIAVPLAITRLDDRFAAAPLATDYDERAAFEKAAWLIIADHPFGIGANQYVLVVNTKGYAERAGIEPTYGSRSANVHNVYLLMAAETGILGGFAFIAMLLSPAIYGLHAYRAAPTTQRNELLLGLSIAIFVVALHSLFEWVFIMYSSQYLFAACVGLIGGITRREAIEAREYRQRKALQKAEQEGVPAIAEM